MAHIADVEFELGAVERKPHIMLFLFVAAEHADLGDAGVKKAVKDSATEGASASGDEKGFIGKQELGWLLRVLSHQSMLYGTRDGSLQQWLDHW